MNTTNGSYCLGYAFQATTNTTVTQLGFYDDFQNGLFQGHDVGLYNSGGSLIASTTVINSDPLVGFFRYHSIAPVSLTAGQTYVVSAVTGAEEYTYNPIGFSVDPRINYLGDRWVQSGSLQFPTNSTGLTGYFGANIRFGDGVPTAGALTPPTATEGVPFSNVTIFHFTDADPGVPSDFTAVVHLGDGNSVALTSTPSVRGQIVANAGGFDVQLSYTYAEELTGQFSVTVTDSGGANSISASTADLSVTSGSNLWLRADAGVTTNESGLVTAWADQSGQGHDATQSNSSQEAQIIASAINGHAALAFNGFSDFYSLAGQVLTSQQFTIFAVANDTGGSSSSPSQREILSNWTSGNGTQSVFFGTATGTPGTRSARLSDDFGGSSGQGVGVLANPATPFVFTGINSASDTVIYQNGNVIADKGSPLATRSLTTNYVIGQQGSLNSEFWAGDIAEILVYNRALSTTERQSVQNYLMNKYVSTVSTFTVGDAPLSNLVNVPFNATEGTPFSGTVASFTDTDTGTASDPTTNPTDYSATINWGDGSTSAGTIAYSGTPGNFAVNASGAPHTYAEDGSYFVSVTVTDVGGSTATAAPGLVALWKGESNPRDSVRANNGALINGATYAPGKVGQAFSFDGVNSYFTTSNPVLSASGPFSVSAWVKPNSATGAYQPIISEIGQENTPGQFQLRIDPNGSLTFFRRSGLFNPNSGTNSYVDGFTTSSPITAGGWSQITAVYQGGTSFQIDVNGVLQAGTSFTNSNYSSSVAAQTRFATNDTATEQFGGLIDEVGLYSRALSAAEVQAAVSTSGAGIDGAVSVPDAALNAQSVSLSSINEGASTVPLTVASFTHGTIAESGITATINWGIAGHTADPGTVVSDGNGKYHVTGVRPVYAEEGTYSITVNISDDNASATAMLTLSVQDAPLLAAVTPTVSSVTASSSYVGFEPQKAFDGSTADWWNSLGVSESITARFAAQQTFAGVSLYAVAGPTSQETYSIYGSNDAVNFTLLGQSTQTVVEGPVNALLPITFPTATYQYLRISVSSNASYVALNEVQLLVPATTNGIVTPPSAVEGQPVSNWNAFHFSDTDPNAVVDDYQATVHWGDGSPDTILTNTPSAAGKIAPTNPNDPGQGFDVLVSHTYAEDISGASFSIQVQDTVGTTVGDSGSVTVAEPAFVQSSNIFFSANEGNGFGTVTVAYFTHGTLPETGLTATIDWGIAGHHTDPGTVVSDGGGNYRVTGVSPTYAEDGTYTITTTIVDDGVSSAAFTGTVFMTEGSLDANPATLVAINEGTSTATVTVATFAHGTTLESGITATIDWGIAGHHADSGTVVSDNYANLYHVTGVRPVYAEEGTYTITVNVNDDSISATTSTSLIVKDAPRHRLGQWQPAHRRHRVL